MTVLERRSAGSLEATYHAATTGLARLSRREHEVLRLVALGLSDAAIAAQLHLPLARVEGLCARIFATLDLVPSPHLDRRVLAVLTLLQARAAR